MVYGLVSVGCLALIALSLLVPLPEQKVVFLDVGQGDAILLQDGTKQVLIDGGPGRAVLEQLSEELPSFDRRLEVVVVTHPDQDHLEGVLAVLDRYEVDVVLLPQMSHTSQLQAAWLTKLQEKVEEKEVDYRWAWAGQSLQISEALKLQFLGPWRDAAGIYAPGKKTNNAAVLTRVDFRELTFLLTGDAESAVERRLVQEAGELLDVEILKAGHHGSKTSTTQELLDAATPVGVVISVGEDNRYGHPHPTVLQRLADFTTWRTDEQGSISFRRVGEKWLVKGG
jgi:competence protein ComEC